MKYLFLAGMMWLSMPVMAQKITSKKEKQTKTVEKVSIQNDTLAQLETASMELLGAEVDTENNPETAFRFPKKECKYLLKDHDNVSRIDSLWMRELTNSELFENMYKTVTNMEYDSVAYNELTTEVLKQRLEVLNQKTPFNVEYNPALESVIKSFLKNRRKTLERLMSLSHYYFPLFEQEMDNANIPLEMKYLSIVESALNPRARSRVGATGLWQFMYPTGKMYGLDVSSYVDERSDPIRSTKAAAKYLSRLYAMFNDWDLALAAYNSGPGNVTKAIRRSGGKQNYWNLRPHLPRETAGYVPAFLATMYIFEYAQEHGFNPKKHETIYFQTDTVQVKRLITFDQLTELLDVSKEQLQFFNPSYKLDIVPFVEGKKYSLRLPKDLIGKFVANEESIYAFVEAEKEKMEKPLPALVQTSGEGGNRIYHRVKSGDVLGKIANKYGVTVTNLKRWNSLRSNTIQIGQRLTIYTNKKPLSPSTVVAKSTSNSGSKAAEEIYVVQKGDTLWSIAQKFPKISIEDIQKWNDISGEKLQPGMKLKMCQC